MTFSSGVQALRRSTESLSNAIGGALGVAADPYPHQLATVSEILTDVRIRHLIADEVGLGKTVQALMIINALRCQDPHHRTVIIAPERLIGQWQDETWTRAHVRAALVGTQFYDRAESPPIILVRPKDVMDTETNFNLDPNEQTLLIVDEPQSLQQAALDAIARVSSSYQQLLVLSATPGLSNPRMRETILTMIEPERTALAHFRELPLIAYFDQRESEAISRLQLDIASGAEGATEIAFRTGAISRRVIRQSRKDWGDFLPERKNFEVLVSPIQSERLQLNFVEKLVNSNPEKSGFRNFPWTSIRAILRSRVSARRTLERISDQQPSIAKDAQILRAQTLEDPGNSRLAPLLDILSSEWSSSVNEKFIIVCGDAATTDMLSTALSRYFPNLASENGISILKRPASATEESAEDIREMSNSIRPFTDGTAKVLLIGDWVQPGLNLQFASRNIIFYSLPWEPESIDQFIGRIDRLRRNGLWKAENKKHFGYIRIWRLILRDSPEEYLSKGLDALGIFERPLSPIPESDMDIALQALEKMARKQDVIESLATLKSIAKTNEATGLNSKLANCAPNSADKARRDYEDWQRLPPTAPSLLPNVPDNVASAKMEDALRGWLKIIQLSGDFDIRHRRRDRDDDRVKFSTFWYKDKRSTEPFHISGMRTDNWMTDHVPFISQRRTMTAPPRKTVKSDDGESDGRLLNFFDHGNSLHDDLVRGYVSLCQASFSAQSRVTNWVVQLPTGHPALQFASQPILLSAGFSDPGRRAEGQNHDASMQLLASSVSTPAQRKNMSLDLDLFNDRRKADERWIRSIVPAMLQLRASRFGERAWIKLDEVDTKIVFSPLGIDGALETAPRSRAIAAPFVSDSDYGKGCSEHRESIQMELRHAWKTRILLNREKISVRKVCIASEGQDFVDLRRQQETQRRAEMPSAGQENMWKGQVEALQKRAEMAEQMLDARTSALETLYSPADNECPNILWHIMLRFMPLAS